MVKNPSFRLLDFHVSNLEKDESRSDDSSSSENEYDSDGGELPDKKRDNKYFTIEAFGKDEKGKTYSVQIENFEPFFYVKVGDHWTSVKKKGFIKHIQRKISPRSDYYKDSITGCKLIKNKKLYGFDGGKLHTFICIKFKNTTIMNKVRGLWFTKHKNFRKRRLLDEGYKGYYGEKLILYEAKLPPLLRYFHIKEISPSGWIELDKGKITNLTNSTTCDYQYSIHWKHIKAIQTEKQVKFKIMSFDIEASSSHGDFPLAKKTYRKPIGEMIEYYTANKKKFNRMTKEKKIELFKEMILSAFGYGTLSFMSKVYLKRPFSRNKLNAALNKILEYPLSALLKKAPQKKKKDDDLDQYDDEDEIFERRKKWHPVPTAFHKFKNKPVYACLFYDFDSGDKLDILDRALEYNEKEKQIAGYLPPLEGDKCTFIGSTFRYAGEADEYFNHMIALNTCDNMTEVDNSKVESKDTEAKVLLAWKDLIQREDPDIIIGYNIFGFDWKFMIQRTKELNCLHEFRKLSRKEKYECTIVDTSLKVASGTHELQYIKIPGRIQIDLYTHFRKAVNLSSYKLDNVASHFIGDHIKEIKYIKNYSKITTGNLTGLKNSHYICFEILGNSTDMYKNGKKYKVKNLDLVEKTFEVEGNIDIGNSRVRWCLAKDDITPQDIFRLTNQGSAERAIVAKYCIQDCNLVHHLMRKNDLLSEFIELSAICSIPIDMAIMRGQGIRLLSFIAKKCREKQTLMPVVEKPLDDMSYEGAICLPPKCALYKDNPVACVDYSSLYPSCMISENISHDSKVHTVEYDLEGNIVEDEFGNPKITGERDSEGNFKYDNMLGYKYVDITYDTYEWRGVKGKKKQEKVKIGTKTCRYAQLPNNKKSIMPSVLKGLLAARKATRSKIKYKTLQLKNGKEVIGVVATKEKKYIVKDIYLDGEELKVDEKIVKKKDVVSISDTYDTFMKGVFNQRQAAIKVVANSLYGQCGAKTSSFFEMDIAAATTATGRKLLLYAKRVIEDIYGNNICDTADYGKVRTKATYIYGDTDSVFFTFNLEDMKGNKIRGKKALEITIELAQEAGALATQFLKEPHDLEYEKTFMPFLLLSKKRYVGILYEFDPNKGKRKEMGIVLKRRDNAPVVKDVYGGIVDRLMRGAALDEVVKFTRAALYEITEGKVGIDKLIISKSLRGFYKNPNSIAHKVLAERIGKRDPGKKPSVGSRIPYVYIQKKGKIKLQGERIETPDYIKEHSLIPDYSFYITNQIQKPVSQIFSLILDQIPEFSKKVIQRQSNIRKLKRTYKDNDKKYREKLEKLNNSYVDKLIFKKILNQAKDKITKDAMKNFFGGKLA